MITELVNRLERELVEIEKGLEPKGYSIIQACPFIVASADGFYTVGLEEDGRTAKVVIDKTWPTQFGPDTANDLVTNFKASNGHGPITWLRMTETEFYTIKANSHRTILDGLKAIA